MSWAFRKSLTIGPFRVTVSKSGISYSVGTKGFRTGVNAKGREYTTVSIPESGLRYTKYQKQK